MSEVIIKIIAKNPPSILFVLAFLSLVIGSTTDNPLLLNWATNFFIIGIVLQVLWLVMMSRR
jgi:threonine/homoserine/homoserine lactone efflux protein